MTIQEVIQGMIRKTGVTPLPPEKTCDQLMAGSLSQEVKRIGSTFMATVDVIRKAADLGVNLIITHEPTWFTGRDDTEWLRDDPIYIAKKNLIEETGVAIWRFHDHMHMDQDDGIFRGIDRELGWREYRIKAAGDAPDGLFGGCYQIPATTLRELATFFKKTLAMEVVQIVGDPGQPVRRVGIMPGGGSLGLGSENMPMRLMAARDLDLIICGEITEWTLPAYVRDATQLGFAKAILVLGHERSEEPGMKHLGDWMKSIVGDIEVVFIDSEEPFTYL